MNKKKDYNSPYEILELGDGYSLEDYGPDSWKLINPIGEVIGNFLVVKRKNFPIPSLDQAYINAGFPNERGKGLGRRAIMALVGFYGALRSDHKGLTGSDAEKAWKALGASTANPETMPKMGKSKFFLQN